MLAEVDTHIAGTGAKGQKSNGNGIKKILPCCRTRLQCVISQVEADPPGFHDVVIANINTNSTTPHEFSKVLQFLPFAATFPQI